MKKLRDIMMIGVFAYLGFNFLMQNNILMGVVGILLALFWLKELKR
jgi:hypothetical protein